MPWPKGVSGNPQGRPPGARDKLSSIFLKELLDDYTTHGKDAIVRLRENEPGQYVRLIASLLPQYRFVDVDSTVTLVDLLTGIALDAGDSDELEDSEAPEDEPPPVRH